MNLSEMSRPLNISQDKEGDFYLTVRPGYLLASLRRDLRSRRFDWLDPAKVNSAAFSAFKEAPEQFKW